MLPILRIIPVGGVFLAIAILVLAFRPPEGFRSQFPASAPRGALIERADHPEWRQFLILAATQRAGELTRLRELPDTPVRSDKAQNERAVAGLPADRGDADPDDASLPTAAGPTLPMEIGEPSSTELPVSKQEDAPPAITPALLKSGQSRVHRARRAAAKPQPETSKAYVGDDVYQAKAGSINY